MSVTRRALLAGTVLAAPAVGRAQSALPDRALRIVVGFPSGGGIDLVARVVAPTLERLTGRRVAVDNWPGHNGAAAAGALTRAPPDGSIIALLPSSTLSSKLLVPAWPLDPLNDLAPIMTLGTYQTAIAVSREIPPTSLAEYVTWLKDGDDTRHRLGLPASDALLEVYTLMVGRALGVTLKGVPFRGGASMVGELQEGKIPAAYGGVDSFIAAHRGARLRMLACSGPQRLGVIKDVPTVAELGHPGMLMIEWYGMFARAGTPVPLIEAWNKALSEVLAGREVMAELAQLGVDVDPSTPQQCAAMLVAHLTRWREVLESFGIQPLN